MAPPIIEGIDNEVLFVVSVLATLLTMLLVHLVYNSNATNRTATEHVFESNISSDPNQSGSFHPTDRADENTSQEQGSAQEVDSENIGLSQTTTTPLYDDTHDRSASQPENDRVRQRGPTQSTSDASGQQGPTEEPISIRVKFMENQRNLSVNRSIAVGELKRLCFQNELNNGMRVRLIYNGKLLQDDSAPVSFYGVADQSVIHAQISDAQRVSGEHSGRQDEEGLIFSMDPSKLFLPILAIILILCWYGLFNYRHLFSAASVIILIFMTLAFGFLVYVVTS